MKEDREEAFGFSLCDPDPWERLHELLRLSRRDVRALIVRAILPALVVWLPLLIMELLRNGVEKTAAVGFFQDIGFHVRFLVVIPILVLAEAPIDRQTRLVAIRFATGGLVGEENMPRLARIVARTRRLVRSKWIQALILLLAVGLVTASARALRGDDVVAWYEEGTTASSSMGLEGWWYLVGSVLPLFLMLRWAWRYGVWTLFLASVARMPLALLPAHPDRSAGLGFVGVGHSSFCFLAGALSASVAAVAATRIFVFGATLPEFKIALPLAIVLILFVCALPLVVFTGPLAMVRRKGLLFHGDFANRFVADFQDRVVASEGGDSFEGIDIQSLADIGASYERVETMRMVPIDMRGARAFAGAIALPMVLLVLATVPTKDLIELLKKAMG